MPGTAREAKVELLLGLVKIGLVFALAALALLGGAIWCWANDLAEFYPYPFAIAGVACGAIAGVYVVRTLGIHRLLKSDSA